MTDDIVTRLRELGRYVNTEGGRWFEPITTEAADEIERLRAEVARLGSFIHPIGTVTSSKKLQSGLYPPEVGGSVV